MRTSLEDLKGRVRMTLGASEMSAKINEFHVEEAKDDEGGEFLRVIFDMKPDVVIADNDLESLIAFAESIEGNLSVVDERLASVRFADAD